MRLKRIHKVCLTKSSLLNMLYQRLSALILASSVSAGEKPRSSKISPLVMWPGLLPLREFVILSLLHNSLPDFRQPVLRSIEILALGFGRILFEAIQNIDRAGDACKVNHSVPGILV
jgi:hypothetical protein